MKRNSLFIMILIVMTGTITGQCNSDSITAKIRNLMNQQLLYKEKPVIAYNSSEKNLTINDNIIPLTNKVILKQKTHKEKGKAGHVVEFYYQNGVAVTKTSDQNHKRAYFEIMMNDRKSASEFISLYQLLTSCSVK